VTEKRNLYDMPPSCTLLWMFEDTHIIWRTAAIDTHNHKHGQPLYYR